MPSIFIWKSDRPNNSKKNIRYYSGSNWVLEDNEYSSKSYIFLEQIVIPGSNDSVITFHTKNMPQDWTGSELLEVTCVPYELLKTDNYGVLERIGEWIRFTSKNEITFSEENLKNEYSNILKWIHQGQNNSKQTFDTLDVNKIKTNFQEFLTKYNIPLPQQTNIITQSTLNNYKNTPYNEHNNKKSKFNNKHSKINSK